MSSSHQQTSIAGSQSDAVLDIGGFEPSLVSESRSLTIHVSDASTLQMGDGHEADPLFDEKDFAPEEKNSGVASADVDISSQQWIDSSPTVHCIACGASNRSKD